MRILVLAPQPFFQQRGTPIAVRALVETLAHKGHELDLLVFHEGEPIDLPGVTLHRARAFPGIRNVPPGFSVRKVVGDVAMLLGAIQLVRRNSYDLIHAVEEAVFLARLLHRLTGLPYVYDMDSSMPEQLGLRFRLPQPAVRGLERVEAWAVRPSLGVIAVCPSLVERIVEIAADKPVVCLEDFSHLESVEKGHDPGLDLGVDGPIFMYVGNLQVYQGIDLLLSSFARVVQHRPDAHLVVIGGSRVRIHRYIRRSRALSIGHRTHFVGPRSISHLRSYLEQAEVLVSPRIQGRNTPLKIYSYLDSGRPILATRVMAHTQVLDDSISVLAEPTPESMSEGALRLLEDVALRKQLARRARRRARERYSREAFERKLLSFYGRLENLLTRAREKPVPQRDSCH